MNRSRFNARRLNGSGPAGSAALSAYTGLLAFNCLRFGGPRVRRTATAFDGADVQSALQAWWASRADLRALTADGRLWHIEAPETTGLPYLTFMLVAEPEMDARTTAYYVLDATLQLSAHAATDAAAAALRNAVRDAVAQAPLSVGGNKAWYCLPGTQFLTIGEGRGPNGSDCWMATVDCSVPWQKNVA